MQLPCETPFPRFVAVTILLRGETGPFPKESGKIGSRLQAHL